LHCDGKNTVKVSKENKWVEERMKDRGGNG
jgi:hypothetical protein